MDKCGNLAAPTILSNGKRIPGLKLDHPRQIAFMHALVRFAHVAAGNTFGTAELLGPTVEALGCSPSEYSLASLRYDLSKLRAKRLVEKIPRTRRYRLLPKDIPFASCSSSYSSAFYAPLAAGLLRPFGGDSQFKSQRSQLDRLYQRVVDDLEKLLSAVGLKAA